MPGARCRRFRAACRAGLAAAAVAWCWTAAALPAARAQEVPPAPAPDRNHVRTIEFTGLRWARPGDLLALMKTKAGRPFNRALFELDVVQLGKKGFFVRSESLLDGRLVLDIDERPTIRRIDVKGPDELTVADVRAALGIVPGEPLTHEVLLERARAGVEAIYRRKGYRFARVAITTTSVPRGVTLTVRVDEGPRTYIEAIRFHGAHGIDLDDLEDVMNTEASTWITSKYLDHDVLDADIARIQRHYRELGWRDARVTLAGLQYSGDGGEVTIDIQVEEGARYTVVGFRIEGNDAVTTEELTELVELEVGEPLDARRIFGSPGDGIRGDVERFRAVYQDEGYYNVQIQPETRVPDPAKRELIVVYNILEGQRTRIGRVDIIGNRITREDVIRRRLPFRPGDKIRTEALRAGMLQLMQTQYFAGVEPELRPSARPGFTDIIFKVQEAETVGNFNFGGALSQGSGFQATASLTINNFDIGQWSWPWNLFVSPHFRGGGQRLQASVAFGRRESNYTLSFNEPYLFGTRNALSLTGQLSTQSEIDFDVRREGGGFSLSRRLFPWLSASLGMSGEFVRVDDVGFFAPQELFALEQLGRKPLVKLRGGLTFDFADRDIGRLPYRGLELSINGEWAHDVIGSHWSFAAIHVEPKVHWTVFGGASEWRHILTLRTSFDYAEPLDGQDRVPFFERYFAGGWGTVRGFDRRDVGPRENNRPVGGEFLFAGALEYTFPLWRDNLGTPQHRDIVRAVLFYDFAALDHTFKDYDTASDWRTSVGFGFRLSVPGFPFPFALDFGWPIKKEDGDDTQRISFTFDVRFG